MWEDSAVFVGNTWFEPFGFFKGLLDPKTGAMPDVFEEGLVLVGTVDTVTRQIERLLQRISANLVWDSLAAELRRRCRLQASTRSSQSATARANAEKSAGALATPSATLAGSRRR